MHRKRYGVLIFVLIFILCNICAMADVLYTGKCGTEATYTIDDAYVLNISGVGAMDDYTNVLDTNHVLRQYRHEVQVINIEEGITHIGAFAFSDYANIEDILIADSVESIGTRAFIGCQMTEISLPSKLQNIPYGLFMDCPQLSNIHIYNTIDIIEEDAFFQCPSLSTVYFHGTEEEWNAISIADGNDDLLRAKKVFLTDELDKAYAYTTDKSSITRAYDFDTKTLTVGAAVTSRTDAGAVKVIVAVYNADGRLMQTAIKDTFFDKNETKQLEIPLENVEYPFDKVAVFVWDYAEMMKPMALRKIV